MIGAAGPPPEPRTGQPLWRRWLGVGLAAFVATPLCGAVTVAGVPSSGPGAAAGLQAGDRIRGWVSPDGALEPIPSPFAFYELELELGPRGTLVLYGDRGDRSLRWEIPPHPASPVPSWRWRIEVTPDPDPARLRLEEELRTLLDTGHAEGASSHIDDALARGLKPLDALWQRDRLATELVTSHPELSLELVASDAITSASQRRFEAQWAERRAEIARRAGAFDEMEAAWLLAADHRARVDSTPLALATTWRGLAIHAASTDDPAGTSRWTRRSLEAFEEIVPGSLAAAQDLGNLGYLELEKGRLVEAEILQRRALRLREAHDSSLVAPRWNLATIAQTRGDHDSAAILLEEALEDSAEEGYSASSIATLMSNLASVAENRDRLDDAESWERRALAIRERHDAGGLDLVSSLEGLGSILISRGNREAEARELLLRALELIQTRAPGSLMEAEILERLAHVSATDEEAAERWSRALEIARDRAPDTWIEARVAHAAARNARERGDEDTAIALLREAVDALDHQLLHVGGTDEVRAGFRSRFAAVYRDLVDLLARSGREEEALEALEHGRARGFLSMLHERSIPVEASLPDPLRKRHGELLLRIDELLSQLAAESDPQARQGLRDELTLLRVERRDLRTEVLSTHRSTRSSPPPRPTSAPELRAALPSGHLLVAYSVGPDRTWRFSLAGGIDGRIEAKSLDLRATELEARVDVLRSALASSATPLAQRRAIREADRLGAMLLGGLFDDTDLPVRLAILPDGPLHAVPFAALRLELEGQEAFLVELAELHTIGSIEAWGAARKRGPAPGRPTIVAFADPEIAAGGDLASLPWISALRDRDTLRLPGARREVEILSRLFGDSARSLLGADATESAAKELGPGARILHFATHGLLDHTSPVDSALLMAIPESWRPGDENGLLQAWEVADELQLDADLVTLSACSTARGREVGGEGVLGLTRAFRVAGARSVLSSLWPIDDTSTTALMASFYRRVLEGASRSEALRGAQLHALAAPSRSAPIHWAGFQLSGDPD